MPTPKFSEGFYWVRSNSEDEPDPFVAHRFAHTWFVPGEAEPRDGRALRVIEGPLSPPQPGKANR